MTKEQMREKLDRIRVVQEKQERVNGALTLLSSTAESDTNSTIGERRLKGLTMNYQANGNSYSVFLRDLPSDFSQFLLYSLGVADKRLDAEIAAIEKEA